MIKVAQTSNVIKDAVNKIAAYGARSLPDMYRAYRTSADTVTDFLTKHAVNWGELGRTVGKKMLQGGAIALGAAPVLYVTGRAISNKAKRDAEETVDYAADKTKNMALKGLTAAAAAYLGYKGLQAGYRKMRQRQGSYPEYYQVPEYPVINQNTMDKVSFLVASGRFYEDYCTLPGEQDGDAFESFIEKISSTLQVRTMLEEAMSSEKLPKNELIKAAAMHGINTLELFGTLKDYYEAMHNA